MSRWTKRQTDNSKVNDNDKKTERRVYVWRDRQTDRKTDRQTDKQTDRHMDGLTDK
jgi:hypothetical protein